MKKECRRNARWPILVGLSFQVLTILACSNPLSRFTKQYRCQISGKPDPTTAFAYVERGMEHVRAEEFDCALGACSEAIRLDSRLPMAYACRGGVLSNRGEYSKALEDFDKALKLQPENGDFYYSRAQVCDRLEETDLALTDLAKAVELIKSEFGRSVAYSRRAAIYQKQGRLDDAINDLTEAIRLAPEFPYHHANRGDVYLEKNQFGNALADYSEAIRLDPKNRYFYSDRAKAYRALGQEDLAIQDETSSADRTSHSEETTRGSQASTISGGDLTKSAVSLPEPPYPSIARTAKASGTVIVQVTVDEDGRVVSARAISGHPLLQPVSVAAARRARFEPRNLSGKRVRVTGIVKYVFESK